MAANAAAAADTTPTTLGPLWALTQVPASVSFTPITSLPSSSLPAVGLGPDGLVTTVPYLSGDATPTTKAGPGAGRMTILTEAKTIYSAAPTLPGFTSLSDAQQSTSHGNKTSTGGLVAAVLIPIVFAGLLAGGFGFWWIRRRKRLQIEKAEANGRGSGTTVAAAERGRGRGRGQSEKSRARAPAGTKAAPKAAPNAAAISAKKRSSGRPPKVEVPMSEAPRLRDERAARHTRRGTNDTAVDNDSQTDVEDKAGLATTTGPYSKAKRESTDWSSWNKWKPPSDNDDPFGDVAATGDKSPTESSDAASERRDRSAGSRRLQRGSRGGGNG